MVRRTILVGTLLLVAGPLAIGQSAPETPRFDYDWVFIYYMSYDNDLEGYGPVILDMLARGIRSERAALVCVADFRDEKGMKRYLMTKGTREVTALAEEGSAEEEVVAAQLAWVAKNLSSRKYALVFLDHGGKLSEMSMDEHPGKKGGQYWLDVREVAGVVSRFRKEVPGEVELLFLQQCGKGTLENYHAFRGAARYLMGSQTRVGAPNYYYTAALRYAGEHPEIDGKTLAAKMAEHETPNMFTTYTVVDATALEELPRRLEPVLAPLAKLGEEIAAPAPDPSFTPCFDRKDERFFDGLTLLEKLYDANGIDREPLTKFTEWVGEDLIVGHRVSPLKRATAGLWCGFSLFFPENAAAFDRYGDYPIYKETLLDEVLGRALS